jgi:hypothetical protein
MSKWLNNKTPIHKAGKINKFKIGKKTYDYEITKPCHELNFCPYGQLVEEYPLDNSEMSCQTFGHNCPVFYLAELITE